MQSKLKNCITNGLFKILIKIILFSCFLENEQKNKLSWNETSENDKKNQHKKNLSSNLFNEYQEKPKIKITLNNNSRKRAEKSKLNILFLF